MMQFTSLRKGGCTSGISTFRQPKGKSSSVFFQPKLTVGPVDDAYEREADSVADQVMRMNNPDKISTISTMSMQRKCAACEEEEHLQKKGKGGKTTSEAPSIVSDALGSTGRSMDTPIKTAMESRFGYDFSRVKIHTDTLAAKSADAVNAFAYTSGNSIVFNKGQYAPQTASGQRLLAHELTHVVQQRSSEKIQRSTKDMPCTVHAYDESDPKDSIVPEKTDDKSVIGVSDVDNMISKVNTYIDSPDNDCKCVSRLEIAGHGTDGYQSVGNGKRYVNDNKALAHESTEEHLKKMKGVKFCDRAMLLLLGCHVGQGKGKILLKKLSNILPGVLIGGSQHYTFGKNKGGWKVVGEGDEIVNGNVKDTSKASAFVASPYVSWHLTVNGKEYIIEGKDAKSTESQSKLKAADKVKVVSPEGEIIKIK